MKRITFYLYTKSLGFVLNATQFVFPKKVTKIVYNLFSTPRAGKLKQKRLPKILQESKREKMIDGSTSFQSYTWQGNQRTILLVHGWESNSKRWKKLLPFLKKTGCTIVAIDAPAHGLSDGKNFSIPEYAEFIRLAVQRFNPEAIIGHSIGGFTCLYYQYLYQSKDIKKMVILGTPSDFNTILYNFIRLFNLNLSVTRNIEDYFSENLNINIHEFSAHFFAQNINTTGFIAHDTNDDIVYISEARKIATAWKNAVLYETKGLGHSMHDDAFYEKVTSFLL